MKQICNISEVKQKQLLDLADVLNFFRKRTRDSKLEVAEKIAHTLELIKTIEVGSLVDWLDDNRGQLTKEKSKSKAVKAPVNTMTGSTAAKAQTMPVIETDQPVIVTSAQNNTACSSVFNQLKALAEFLNAKLIVLPVYYNKTAYAPSVESEDERFNDAVKPYLVDADTWLFKRGAVRLAAEAAVLPTAKLPINAAAALLSNGEQFCVVPSPKQQYKTLPTLDSSNIPKAWTTGGCTQFNYVRGRAGSEAEQQHVFGGVLFTQDDSGAINSTNIRQADDGTINLYLAETRELIQVGADLFVSSVEPRTAQCKLGDLHCEVYDPVQWSKALDLVSSVKPAFVAVDDVLHFSTRSHHNRNNAKHLYVSRNESVENDLRQVINQLNELAAIVPVFVTESNHNSALDNWIHDTSLKIDYDSHNAKLYHLIKWLVMDSLDEGHHDKNALEVALSQADLTNLPELSERVEFGRMDVPKIGVKYDCSQHGHKGQNGSAANPNQMSKWGLFLITGHTHSPSIIGNVFTTGVAGKLNQGYNRGGASSWDHAHVIEHYNGECQLINTNNQVAK
jgi:hypothetical protein